MNRERQKHATIKDMLLNKKILLRGSLQVYLIIGFLFLSLITFATIFSYGFIENNKANISLGESFIKIIRARMFDILENKFAHLQFLSGLGDQLYNSEKEVNLDNIVLIGGMREILRDNPIVKSVMTGTENGKFLQIRRIEPNDCYRLNIEKKLPSGSFFALRYMDHTSKNREIWVYESREKKVLDKEFIPESKYDHRNQPWYRDCEERREINWTNVYLSQSFKKPGVTISNAVYNVRTNEFIGVFAFNIETSSLSNILKQEKIGADSSLFITSKKGEIIAHSDHSENEGIKNRKLEIPIVYNSTDFKMKKALEIFENSALDTFSFEYEKVLYIATFSVFPNITSDTNNGKMITVDDLDDWVLGIIIPADEFVGKMKSIQKRILLISMVFLLLSLFTVIFFARRISKPIMLLAEEANRIKNFDLTGVVELNSNVKEIRLLNEAIASMKNNIKSFSKFMPKVLVRKLLKNNLEIGISGKIKRTSLLFTDIVGFTSICEAYPADKLSEHLSDYFEEVSNIIFQYNGTIDKYIGDAVMAFWGAPEKDKDQSLNACKAALAIQKRLNNLNGQWDAQGKPVLNTRIGIHVGNAIVGTMGSSDRINYTALGDSVNLAARLEGTNKFYRTSVIISEAVLKDIEDSCLVRPLDIVAVKGKSEGIEIYELVGITKEEPYLLPSKNQIGFCTLFSKGYKLYKERRWDEAIEIFKEVHQKFGEDYTNQMYISRCKDFKKNPPPLDWNGVCVLKEK